MAEALTDRFGRVHRDLRISVTDRCNFRCTYCMPEDGLVWLPRDALLTFEEVTRVAELLVDRFAITSIRLTGGEPTLRSRLDRLISMLSDVGGRAGAVDLAMTTNGSTLARQAGRYAEAGLGRINVSLDTLRPDRFVELTRRDELSSVIEGIDAAIADTSMSVKVNAVVMAGVNDDEVVELAAFGRERGVEMRFIEFMPLDADQAWSGAGVVSGDEIAARVTERWPAEPVERTAAPATRFRYLDGRGTFGVISSVTRPFCSGCDRVRLTAEGQVRNCLFAAGEIDLRAPLRDGADDDELAELITRCVAGKAEAHGIGNVNFIRPARSMSQIGG